MKVFDAVRTILAVRRYRDAPVPEDVLRRIVLAAHMTGSSVNLQPWHFIIVRDRDMLRRIGRLARTGPYIAQAAFAIVVPIEHTRYAVSDASRAIQSMLLVAWADGVGSNWVGFHGLEGVRPLLGIPGDLEVFAVVPFGYPEAAHGPKGRKKRKPIAEVAHLERFGEPFRPA